MFTSHLLTGEQMLDALRADLVNEGEQMPTQVGDLDVLWWHGRAPGEGCEVQELHWLVEVARVERGVTVWLSLCSDAFEMLLAERVLTDEEAAALAARWPELFHVEYDGQLVEVGL